MKLTAQQEKFEAWLKTSHPRGKDENGEYIDDLVWNMFEAWKASQAQPAPLTDEQIANLQEKYVGGPCPGYPLDASDWINFARAVERGHDITQEKQG